MNTELTTVARFASALEAETAKNFLLAEGVQAFVADENATSLFSGMLGQAKLQVAAADADRAKELLNQHPGVADDVEVGDEE